MGGAVVGVARPGRAAHCDLARLEAEKQYWVPATSPARTYTQPLLHCLLMLDTTGEWPTAGRVNSKERKQKMLPVFGAFLGQFFVSKLYY